MKINQKKSVNMSLCKRVDLKDIFRLLRNIKRFRIFLALAKHPGLTSQDIYNILKISRSDIAKHLSALEAKGVLLKNKKNNLIYYSLNHRNRYVKTIKTAFISFLND